MASKNRLSPIPHPPTKPVVGNMLSLDSSAPVQNLTRLAKELGPIFWLDSRVSGMAAIIIVSIWAGLPFNTILLYAGLQDVPREIQEAAMVDGANAWQRFRKVTLPLIRPVAAIVLMLGLIYTVKTFDIVILLTNGGPGNATQLLATDAYTQVFSNLQFAGGAAIGNILLLFCAIISVIYIWSIRRSERQA